MRIAPGLSFSHYTLFRHIFDHEMQTTPVVEDSFQTLLVVDRYDYLCEIMFNFRDKLSEYGTRW